MSAALICPETLTVAALQGASGRGLETQRKLIEDFAASRGARRCWGGSPRWKAGATPPSQQTSRRCLGTFAPQGMSCSGPSPSWQRARSRPGEAVKGLGERGRALRGLRKTWRPCRTGRVRSLSHERSFPSHQITTGSAAESVGAPIGVVTTIAAPAALPSAQRHTHRFILPRGIRCGFM